MKQLLCTIIVVFAGFSVQAQNELENIYLSKSTMHGGTSDSGSSTGLAYTYVARKTVTMPNILFEEKKLTLEKNDTIIITLISFSPYQDNRTYGQGKNIKAKKSFSAYFRNGAYRVGVNMEKEFITAATYKFKKKQFVAKRKTEIDYSQENFAP